jgi:hypothetical protein
VAACGAKTGILLQDHATFRTVAHVKSSLVFVHLKFNEVNIENFRIMANENFKSPELLLRKTAAIALSNGLIDIDNHQNVELHGL